MTTKAQHDFVVRLGTGRDKCRRKRSARAKPYGLHAKQVICSNKDSDEKHTGDLTIFTLVHALGCSRGASYVQLSYAKRPETEDHMFCMRCERSQAQGQRTGLFHFADFICLKIVDWKEKSLHLLHLHHILWHGVPFVSLAKRRVHTMDTATNKPIASISQCAKINVK